MARTKNPQRKKDKTKVANSHSQNEAGGKTKNSKLSNANSKAQRKKQPRSGGRFIKKTTAPNEDCVDSSVEETAFQEPSGFKLQDIANIVIGDLKQVRVTEATFSIAEDGNKCYSAVNETPNDSCTIQTDEQRVSGCDDERYDDGAVCRNGENALSEKPADSTAVERLSCNDDTSCKDVDEANKSNQLSDGCATENAIGSEVAGSDGCHDRSDVMCLTFDGAALILPSPPVYLAEKNANLITNDGVHETQNHVSRTMESVISGGTAKNSAGECELRSVAYEEEEEEEDFDLSIPEDKTELLNESYDDKEWVVCDESCDESLRTLEENVRTFSLSKSENVEIDSMDCDMKYESTEATAQRPSHPHDERDGVNISDGDIIVVGSSNEKSVDKINDRISVIGEDNSDAKIEEKKCEINEGNEITSVTNKSNNSPAFPKSEQKSSVITKKDSKDTVKPRRNDEKNIKSDKKGRIGRQRPKKSDAGHDPKNEKQEKRSSNRRRRSDRLKSKPDYNEKYEDQLLAQFRYDKEKDNFGRETKNENEETTNRLEKSNKVEENTVAFSSDSSDMPAFQQILENEYYTER